MAAMKNPRLWYSTIMKQSLIGITRHYRSNPEIDLRMLQPMTLRRIEHRVKDNPVKDMIPAAYDVVRSRSLLLQGVSTLLQVIPVWSCRFCEEVYIGEKGHAIKTCHGYKRDGKNKLHEWVKGGVNDILTPVNTYHLKTNCHGKDKRREWVRNYFTPATTYHLKTICPGRNKLHKRVKGGVNDIITPTHHLKTISQNTIKRDELSAYDRIPAVIELAIQAGAELNELNTEGIFGNKVECLDIGSLSQNDIRAISEGTLRAWEVVRAGVKKLMMVYKVKVCKYCGEVHVGPSGRKVVGGVFKNERRRGAHFWKKGEEDDLMPQKVGWFRRGQDPVVLEDEGRAFYGHAPAVVDLCTKGGAVVPVVETSACGN